MPHDVNGVVNGGKPPHVPKLDESLQMQVIGYPGPDLIEVSFMRRLDIRPTTFTIPLDGADAIMHAATSLRMNRIQQRSTHAGGAVPAVPPSPVPDEQRSNLSLRRG